MNPIVRLEIKKQWNYGFNNVKLNIIKEKNKFTKRIMLDKTNVKYIDAYMDDDLYIVESNDDKNNYDMDIVINKISYPIKKGDIIGKVNAIKDNKIIASVNLISSSDVYKLSLFKLFINNLKKLFIGLY